MFHGKQCRNCGRPVREEAVFCLDCGARVDGSESPDDTFEGRLGLGGPTGDLDIAGGDGKQAGLCVIEGIDAGKRFPLIRPVTRIGRQGEPGDVVLEDPYVSRAHAAITGGPDGFILEDLESTNGIRVNEADVKRHRLSSGDVIEVGYTLLRFEAPTGQPAGSNGDSQA